MAAEDQPRFGARSPQWQDESQESAAPSSPSSVPWEQYGEVVAPARTPRFARFDPSAEASPSSSADATLPAAQESDDPSRRLAREGVRKNPFAYLGRAAGLRTTRADAC